MLEKEFYIITFDSTHHAIQTEKLLKKTFKVEMIPTPREISASCGLSIKFSVGLFSKIMEVLRMNQKTYDIFKVERESGRKQFRRIIEEY